jgi:predicted Zn-ribbon and HTH transcriptional regulator
MYKCKKCGYKGKELIFQYSDYSYCIASNEKEPDFLGGPPEWVRDKDFADAEIGEPVGCPKCHVWGVHNFEKI